jgi:hypothetical protein
MVANWEVIFLILQAVFLFMLVLGVPLSKGAGNKKTFIRHGYLTIAALMLHTISVIFIMIYLAVNGLLTLVDLPLINLITIISHSILGTVALVMGFVIVGFWVLKPLGNMNCYRAKKLMLPTLIIWIISLVLGYIIYFLELF